MLGRPNTWLPVFMNSWPGAWLNCVVCIERTIAMSSAMLDEVRQELGQLGAGLPVALEREGGPEQPGRPLDEREPLPLGMNSDGISSPSCFCRSGLLSNRSSWVGAPAMKR